jgi:zinc transport system permease protein
MIEILAYEFFRNALIAGVLASIACGVVGAYVVVKRMVALSGGISHSAFGGIGAGYYLGINPLLGAVIFSLGAALGIGYASRRAGQYVDTIIGTMWAAGMALGILLISWAPGYAPDLFSYLFGNILFVPVSDLVVMGVLDLLIVGTVALYYNEFLAISFDEEFASVLNIRVERLYLLLLCITALTVVMLIRVVGIILIIALLTIPAAIARQYTHNLQKLMVFAILLGIAFTFSGMWLSYLADIPSGSTIILIASAAYGASILSQKWSVRTEGDR